MECEQFPILYFSKADRVRVHKLQKCTILAIFTLYRAVTNPSKALATIKGANKDALKSKLEEFSKQAGQKPMEGAPVGMNDLASFIDKVFHYPWKEKEPSKYHSGGPFSIGFALNICPGLDVRWGISSYEAILMIS